MTTPSPRAAASSQTAPRHRVAIIGAGLAGLQAARDLHRAGCAVTVFEARDRLGGRTWSRPTRNGTIIDMGAQFIAAGHHRVRALVKEFGLTYAPARVGGKAIHLVNQKPVVRDDEQYPLGLCDQWHAFWFLRRLARESADLPVLHPLDHPQGRALDEQPLSSYLREHLPTSRALAFFDRFIEGELCLRSQEISVLEFLHVVASAGSLDAVMRVDSDYLLEGTQRIAEGLAQSLPPAAVRLADPVEGLSLDGPEAIVRSQKGETRFTRVVLALPVHLWKRINLEAFPSLARQAAQPPLRPGRVVKSLALFAKPFWRDHGLSGLILPDNDHQTAIVDSTFANGGALVTFATSSKAERSGAMTVDQRRQALQTTLERAYGQRAPLIEDFHSHDWTADPWSEGGYASYRSQGGWSSAPTAVPPPVGPIHIAGGDTSTSWRSFMEGALASGERVAKEIVSSA